MPTTNKHSSVYTNHFISYGMAKNYARKFISPLERIRHEHEIELLAPIVQGDVFDCSIATGRFVGELPNVRSYAGMDYSDEFLDQIRRTYPDITVFQGDLCEGIPQPDNYFDATLCLRTLSALGHTESIIAEMSRITRPGGIVVFDYGAKPSEEILNGVRLAIDDEDPENAMLAAGLEIIQRSPLDGFIVRLKRFPRIYWLLGSACRLSSIKSLFMNAERLTSVFWKHRILYVGRVEK